MATKAKKRMHQMPPLSFLDKTIYWSIFLLLCVAYIALMFGPIYLRDVIAFSDASVLAVEDSISMMWFAVPWLTFFLMTFILWYSLYQGRKPIFGNRKIKYGPPAWPKAYPLFMKNKPYVFVSERKRKKRKQITAILLVVLLVSFIPFPWSLYGRSCLRNDGSIVQYNMLNGQSHEFSSSQMERVKIETYRYSPNKNAGKTKWGVRMVFITESGRKYTFEHRYFRGMPGESARWLDAMTKVKSHYGPGIIQYKGAEDVYLVVADQKLTEEKTELLYQLFEQR